jgi:hypothetical protein
MSKVDYFEAGARAQWLMAQQLLGRHGMTQAKSGSTPTNQEDPK